MVTTRWGKRHGDQIVGKCVEITYHPLGWDRGQVMAWEWLPVVFFLGKGKGKVKQLEGNHEL